MNKFYPKSSKPKLFSRVVEIKQENIEKLCKNDIEFKVASCFRITLGMMGKVYNQISNKYDL